MEIKYIEKCLDLAEKSYKYEDFPVGAIIVYNNKVVGKGYNKRNVTRVTYDHAEIIAIRQANKKLKTWRLNDCEMYVSLEPCKMCEKVIKESRIKKVYYLVSRNVDKEQYKGTIVEKICEKNSDIDQIKIKEYKESLKQFFAYKR